jgi:hypothetical protein
MEVTYNAKTQVLTVEYRNGTYLYQNVPQEVFDLVKDSDNTAKAIKDNVKGKYSFTRV